MQPGFRAKGRWRLAAGLLAGATLGWVPSARAESADLPPEGIPLGPVVLTPHWQWTERYDSNVFRRNDVDAPSDRIRSASVGVGAYLPVRNSLFSVDLETERVEYRSFSFPRDRTTELSSNLELGFSTSDQLAIRGYYLEGLSDIQTIDPGGELVFQGQPYDFARLEIELERAVVGHPGYRFALRTARLDFVAEGFVPFFEYSGYDYEAEYRHPLPGKRWLLGYYAGRRYDHYDPNAASLAGDPYRREDSRSWQLGAAGRFGRRNDYSVRAGYADYRLEGEGSGEFRGLQGEGRLSLRIGPRAGLEVNLSRTASASVFDTYYLSNTARIVYDQEWLRYSRAALEVLYARNGYGDILRVDGVPVGQCGDEIRRDNRFRVEGRFDWLVHPQFGFRLSVAREDRNSTCEFSAYETTEAFMGLRLGWF